MQIKLSKLEEIIYRHNVYFFYDFGYEVGRYISLEKVIEENKESYYDSLQKSSKN
jgi:hypothetical protein